MATTDNSSTIDAIANSTSVEQPSPAIKPTTSKSQNGAAKPKSPPPGYKLVRRRKEDGTMITVLRKMTPEELEAAGQKEPATAPNEGVQYKIVTVRNTDGSYIRVKRPVRSVEIASSTAATTCPARPTQVSTPMEKSATNSIPPNVDSKDQRISGVKTSPVTGIIAEEPIDSETAPVAQAQGNNVDMEAALAEQKAYFRKQRTHKYKQSLIRGLGTIAGSAVGHTDFHDSNDSHGDHSSSHDIQDGDIIDSDDDWSDDDMDNDHHDHDDDHSRRDNDANANDHSRKWCHG